MFTNRCSIFDSLIMRCVMHNGKYISYSFTIWAIPVQISPKSATVWSFTMCRPMYKAMIIVGTGAKSVGDHTPVMIR